MADKDITNNENGFGSPEKGEKSKGGKGKRKGKSRGPNAGADSNSSFVSDSTAAIAVSESQSSAVNSVNDATQLERDQLVKLKKAMEMLQMRDEAVAAAATAAANGPAKTTDDAAKKSYEFWSTQPVPKIDEHIVSGNECIEANKPQDILRHDPYTLPEGFHWDTLNLNDPLVLKELYMLLNENYVEDDDNMFRFDYSPEFLRWALLPPGFLQEWHVGVRAKKSKKMVGFISAVPATISIYKKVVKLVEINFLCVHKKLRSKRLAPVLIREITRRVNCQGIFQAVYTAGVVLPKPVATCRYWHRSLNPKKLIEVKFSHLSRNMTMQRHLKLYRLPETTKTEGLRKLKITDIPEACKLLNKHLEKYDLIPVFTEEDFLHWFLPREDIIDTYVVQKPANQDINSAVVGSPSKKDNSMVITDLVSFYTLPSTVMSHATHNKLKAAYSFYNVSTVTPWVDLMGDALVLAKKSDFDVFNALDLMDNEEFLEKLKFGIGDGNLQYYLYNWRCPPMKNENVGLVLQ